MKPAHPLNNFFHTWKSQLLCKLLIAEAVLLVIVSILIPAPFIESFYNDHYILHYYTALLVAVHLILSAYYSMQKALILSGETDRLHTLQKTRSLRYLLFIPVIANFLYLLSTFSGSLHESQLIAFLIILFFMSVIVFYNYAASMIAQRFIRCIQPTAEPHRKPFSFFRVFYSALIAGLTQNTEAKPISKSSEEEPSFYRISAALFRVLCLVLGIIFSAVSLFFLVCCILIIIEGFGFLSVMLLFFSFLSFTVIGCRYFLLFFWIDAFDKIDNALHNGLPEAVMPSGAPDAEAPSAEAPSAEAANAEAANAEAANAEAPSAEAPDVKVPSAEAADAEAPATEAPQA